MTLVMIRHKTQQLQGKTRRDLLNQIAVTVFLVGLCGFGIWWVHGAAQRAAFALCIVWTLASQYFVDRKSLSGIPEFEVSLSTSLESYRREVERRRYLSNRFLLTLAPILIAIVAVSTYLLSIAWKHGARSHVSLISTAPFFTLLVLWFVGLFVTRMRQQRDLQREIDQLNEVERSNNP